MKKTQCFIASASECFAGDIKAVLETIDHSMAVSVTGNGKTLTAALNRDEKQMVIADRYFFGAHLEAEVQTLYRKVPNLSIIVVLYGECAKNFGFRLYRQAINSVIPHLEKKREFTKIMTNLLTGGIKYYPETVREGIRNREHLFQRNCIGQITSREITVIRKVSRGMTLKEISKEINLAKGTVAAHLYNMRQKLGAVNNAEAVRMCMAAGIITGREEREYEGND
jgi:DNA-binding NarL/FixJ family response regulator